MTTPARLAAFAIGALAARAGYAALTRRPPGGSIWSRANHRGEPVTLLAGPALAAAGAAASAFAPGVPVRTRAAASLAAAGCGALGCYDDLAGSGAARGFAGHLRALARGEVTSGAVKLVGIGATGLAAAALLGGRPADLAVNGVLIAGAANLANLFDLRPGRAIKAGMIAGAPLLATGAGTPAAVPLGAAAALLPDDLGERAMLGDAGANAYGALLGVAAAAALGRRGRLAALAAVLALTAASERVSFTAVIEATPALRAIDMLGRRAPSPQVAGSPAAPAPRNAPASP